MNKPVKLNVKNVLIGNCKDSCYDIDYWMDLDYRFGNNVHVATNFVRYILFLLSEACL